MSKRKCPVCKNPMPDTSQSWSYTNNDIYVCSYPCTGEYKNLMKEPTKKELKIKRQLMGLE